MACLVDDNTLEISTGDQYSRTTSGFNGDVTFQYTIIENEIVSFQVAVNNVAGGVPNASLKLFRIELDGSYTQIGTASLNQFNNNFNYDSLEGNYLVCITSIFPAVIKINVDFTTYSGVLLQPFIASNGQSSDNSMEEPVSTSCQSDVNFKFLHGEMPDNFTFRSDGIIFGTAGEQDCETGDDEAPSYNWMGTDENGNLNSTGRPYIFTIRAFLEDYPEVFDDRVFQVCVRNNWTYDITDHGDVLIAEYECQDLG